MLAPDLIGFGRSDKPTDPGYYTYAQHVANIEFFLDANVHDPCTLFAQDWGGLTGLRLVGLQPERFARVAIGNTGLPVGESIGPGFDFWLAYSQESQLDDIGALFGRAVTGRELTDHEKAAYDAPFPTADRRVPSLPTSCPSPRVRRHRREPRGRGRCPTVFSAVAGGPRLGQLHHEFMSDLRKVSLIRSSRTPSRRPGAMAAMVDWMAN